VRSFDQEFLERHYDAIVERGNVLKFFLDERLKEIVLGTGNREICGKRAHMIDFRALGTIRRAQRAILRTGRE
jgi:hypothetical protein